MSSSSPTGFGVSARPRHTSLLGTGDDLLVVVVVILIHDAEAAQVARDGDDEDRYIVWRLRDVWDPTLGSACQRLDACPWGGGARFSGTKPTPPKGNQPPICPQICQNLPPNTLVCCIFCIPVWLETAFFGHPWGDPRVILGEPTLETSG